MTTIGGSNFLKHPVALMTGATLALAMALLAHADNANEPSVVGGGSAGISVSASLLKRNASLRIAVIEPNTEHYYQPAWTLGRLGMD